MNQFKKEDATHKHSLGNVTILYRKINNQWHVWSKNNKWELAMVNTVNTQKDGTPNGFVKISEEDKNLANFLAPLEENEELLKGMLMMAYIALADKSGERLESFTFSILEELVLKAVNVRLTHSHIENNDSCKKVFSKMMDLTSKLKEDGFLEETSIYDDACPYFKLA